MTPTLIVFASRDAGGDPAPPQALIVEAGGQIVRRGALTLGDAQAAQRMRCVLVLPAPEAVIRWLDLSTARTERQARAAAAILLRDELAIEGEGLHVAVGAVQEGGRRPVVALDPAALRLALAGLAVFGLRPHVVLPAALALQSPEAGEPAVMAEVGDGLAIVRGHELAFAAEPCLAEVVLAGRPMRRLHDEPALEAALISAANNPAINLLQGDFDLAAAKGLSAKDFRLAAGLAAALALAPILLLALDAFRLDRAAQVVERKSAEAVARYLPADAPPGNPAAAVTQRLAAASALAAPQRLAGLFAAVASINQAQIETLIVGDDGMVRVSVSYANVTDVELMRGLLRQTGAAVTEEGTRDSGGRTISDLVLGGRS